MPLDETLRNIHARTMSIRGLVMGTQLPLQPECESGVEQEAPGLGVDTLIHELDVTTCFLRTHNAEPRCNLL